MNCENRRAHNDVISFSFQADETNPVAAPVLTTDVAAGREAAKAEGAAISAIDAKAQLGEVDFEDFLKLGRTFRQFKGVVPGSVPTTVIDSRDSVFIFLEWLSRGPGRTHDGSNVRARARDFLQNTIDRDQIAHWERDRDGSCSKKRKTIPCRCGGQVPGMPGTLSAKEIEDTLEKFAMHEKIVEVMMDDERASPQLILDDLSNTADKCPPGLTALR